MEALEIKHADVACQRIGTSLEELLRDLSLACIGCNMKLDWLEAAQELRPVCMSKRHRSETDSLTLPLSKPVCSLQAK